MNAELLEQILAADNLPSPPALAMQVLKLVQSDDASVKQIAEVVGRDPAMAGRLLKLVNSSLFSRGRKIGSLEQAMVMLGLRAVKVSLLGFSFAGKLQREDDQDFDYPRYWRESVGMAVASCMIAQHVVKSQKDEAFVAGLLADIGQVAAHHTAPQAYDPVINAALHQGRALHEMESERLGFSHDAVSGRLLERWGLPATIVEAAAGHHQSLDDEDVHGLPLVLRLAAQTTACAVEEDTAGNVTELEALLAQRLGLAAAETTELVKSIVDHLPATADAFGLQIADVKSYAQLQMEAAAKVAQLGLMAEVECTQTQGEVTEATQRLDRMQQENQMLRRDASVDKLTGVANRAAFDQHLQQTWNEAQHTGEALAVVLLDVDHFKKLNDTYGHQVGDEALRRIGQTLRDLCSEACFAARYGGEEFALIVRSQPHEAVNELGELVRQRISLLRLEHQGQTVSFTASLGVAHTHAGDSLNGALDFVGCADQLLYEAKRSGRDRVATSPQPAARA